MRGRDLSPLEHDIIQALAYRISQNEETSLSRLAEECHVSKSLVVKALQKLGYRGFGEFTRSLRINAAGGNALLPREVVVGDVDAATYKLADSIVRHRRDRNFCFCSDRRSGDLLASYMSRKLAMFDIMAPASYDYAMTVPLELPCGMAVFCLHRELHAEAGVGQQADYGRGMMDAARKSGFQMVVIADTDESPELGDDDLMIRIVPSQGLECDLYGVRVLMLFENALSLVSKMLGAIPSGPDPK